MKIEKVNDHQIRCTLTKADLADRELKISELAYGTEKAKNLFRDMMQQASAKFGFEADDIPLMIEAIPLNADCIVLIITKVEDPEELDTRFSKFAPSIHEDAELTDDPLIDDLSHTGEEVLDLFKKIKEHAASIAGVSAEETEEANVTNQSEDDKDSPQNSLRVFSFTSLHDLFRPASFVTTFYNGENFLYKEPETGHYLLVVSHTGDKKESFNRACNILSEYGHLRKGVANNGTFYAEHYELISGPDALQKLNM